jgi:amino acid transporter
MTPPTPLQIMAVEAHGSRLKAQCLSYFEVLAQSVSVIAPSTVPAAVLGLIFASAGNGTWLSFLIGMLGLVLVSFNINQFARRSASAGSLYRFIVKGLGSTPGALGGLALLFGYMLTGMSTLCGFVVTAKGLLDASGLAVPSFVLSGAATLTIVLLASRDAQLSAKAMLAFEGAALAAVLALGVVVWRWHGFSIDTAQITLKGATPGGVLSGVVLVVFAFSGFESSTALGEEAKDPLHSIPRSVMQSVVVSGLIFIFMTYVVVLGFRDLSEDLAKAESPLFFLSQKLGVGWLGVFINIGVLVSFYSCTLASVSATARIIYSMARHRVAPSVLGTVHPRRLTPYVAVIFAALLTYLIALGPSFFGVSEFDAQGYFGTLCSFGFLTVYVLISVAAPMFVRKTGELKINVILVAVAATVFMIVPFLGAIGVPGSDLFPLPTYPNNLLIWMYLAYMLAGAAWLLYLRKTRPDAVEDVFEVTDVPLSPERAPR